MALSLAAANEARASCNLIPVAAASFSSTQGGVVSPITAPGETVQLELNGCDPSAGFEKTLLDNQVTIRFEPPTAGGNTDVVLNTFDATLIKSVSNCVLPGGKCRTLTFETPDTTGLVLPDTTVATNGLAGPARIIVRDATNTIVAEIADLNIPSLSCDEEAESVFQSFTVLPRANNFSDVEDGTATQILATVDGGGDLLVPFDYWGGGTKSVLTDRPGTPDARFLEGDAPIEAFTGGGTTISQAIAAEGDPSRFIRSFTLNGRPLPPLLRVKSNGGGLFGAADAATSVLRIAINDGQGGGDLYDVTDRLSSGGRGPIVIGSPVVTVGTPLPLTSLRSSTESVAYARSEAREGTDINLDTDQGDLVPQIVDAATGSAYNTHEAVTPILTGVFAGTPSIVASADLVAYVFTEAGQTVDYNGDSDELDDMLRLFRRDGTNLSPVESASVARAIDGQPIAITGHKVFFRGPSALVEIENEPFNNLFPVIYAEAVAVAASLNGAYVYVTGMRTSDNFPNPPTISYCLFRYTRLSGTGTLSLSDQNCDAAANFPYGLVVSPSGTRAYMSGDTAHSVSMLRTLPGMALLDDKTAAGDSLPLFGAKGMAMSPSGQFLYVASTVSDSLSVFDTTGDVLTFVEAEVNGFGAPLVTGMDAPESVAMSPGGEHVYVVASSSDSVAAFARNGITGAVTFIESERDGVGGVDGLDGAAGVAVSPDGRHVYAAGSFDGAVATFERNALTGELTFVEATVDTSLLGAIRVICSPDGERVYVAAFLSGAAVTFRRNATTGVLVFEDAFNVAPLQVTDIAVDQVAGKQLYPIVYEGFSGGLPYVLTTQHALTVFDADTSNVLTTRPPASRAAIAQFYAAFLRPESADNSDLNGDGDPATFGDSYDDIVQFYNSTVPGGAVTSLDVAGNRVALSPILVAFTVPEANEGEAHLNTVDDGDAADDILHVYEIGALPAPANVINVGVSADAVAVYINKVVFITPEANEPSGNPGCGPTIPAGGCDLNGDLDALDRVLRVYVYNTATNTGSIEETGQPAEEFVTAGNLVAFRTSESSAGEILNAATGDNDLSDAVMQIYDLGTSTLISTGRSAITCFLPGCDPNLPYKTIDFGGNRTVAYLTDEQQEGPDGDLNLDGDADDIVLSLYNVRALKVDTPATIVNDSSSPSANEPELKPFPDRPFDGTLVTTEVHESDIGIDITEDGDLDDVVVMLVGDKDEDGTVDDSDVCRDIDDIDQGDGDGDLLGDSNCDPVAPPPCTSTPRPSCLDPGKGMIQFKNNEGLEKDSFKFQWGQGELTTVADFGNPDDVLTSNYALCVYDDSANDQPVTTMAVLPGPRLCGKKRCWQDLGASGFKFKDKAGTPRGVTSLSLKPGGNGEASVQAKGNGKGLNLDVPALPLTGPVTVQLVVDLGISGERCWSATFPSAQKAGPTIWQARF